MLWLLNYNVLCDFICGFFHLAETRGISDTASLLIMKTKTFAGALCLLVVSLFGFVSTASAADESTDAAVYSVEVSGVT